MSIIESLSPCSQLFQYLSLVKSNEKQLRILDVMLLTGESQKRPGKWLFTDTQGFFCCQDISTISLNELLKAIMANIEGSGSSLEHSDLLVRKYILLTLLEINNKASRSYNLLWNIEK